MIVSYESLKGYIELSGCLNLSGKPDYYLTLLGRSLMLNEFASSLASKWVSRITKESPSLAVHCSARSDYPVIKFEDLDTGLITESSSKDYSKYYKNYVTPLLRFVRELYEETLTEGQKLDEGARTIDLMLKEAGF